MMPNDCFGTVRKLAGIKVRPLQDLEGEQGSALTEHREITDCWRRHFAALLKADVSPALISEDLAPDKFPADVTSLVVPHDFAPAAGDGDLLCIDVQVLLGYSVHST